MRVIGPAQQSSTGMERIRNSALPRSRTASFRGGQRILVQLWLAQRIVVRRVIDIDGRRCHLRYVRATESSLKAWEWVVCNLNIGISSTSCCTEITTRRGNQAKLLVIEIWHLLRADSRANSWAMRRTSVVGAPNTWIRNAKVADVEHILVEACIRCLL